MSEVPATLLLQPDELLYSGVRLNQAYCQTVTISNPSRATVEATLRVGSSDRWTISPTKLVLKPQQSIDVDVRLRVLRFAQKQKAVQQGQRDIFHIKAAYFEQKFYATFFLAPDAQQTTDSAQRQRRPGRTHSADSRSPGNSPRDLLAAKNGATPYQHSPAQPPHSTQSPCDAADAHHSDDHASTAAALDSAQPVRRSGNDDRVSTPDLSPRGDMESEDPPTPRMYKAIIPTGGPGQMQSNVSAPHSPKMALEAAQVVLHQGHFAHGRQHASLQRHAQHAGQEQAMEDLKHTVREKDKQIDSLRSELVAARHRVSVDERAARVSNSIDTAGMSLQAQSQVERLEAANANLEGSNAELRDRLHEVSAQAEAAQAQVAALEGLQSSLQESAGPSVDALVEAAVDRERAVQDARNRKVLELLNNKDEVIQRFEDRCTEANAEIQQLQAALQDTSKRLETADNRLSSTMDMRNKLRKQLEAKHAEMTSMQASLQSDNQVLQDKLQQASSRGADRPASPEQGKLAARLRAELEVNKEALQAVKEESATLASSLQKANSLIESLSAELESKAADLEALQDRCHSKDEQVAALGQQVEQLESSLETLKQADSTRQQQRPYEWAVDVSLDQGVGPGAPHMPPSSPSALRQRVQTLEAANEKLEKALMAGHRHTAPATAAVPSSGAQGGSAAVEATINSLRSLLSDREHQLSRLEADLAIAKAYSGSSQRVVGESAQGESALKIELSVLRQRLSEKEAQVVSGKERLSRLEAVHRVAQETALRSESQLESTRRSLIELDEDKQAGKEEAESARALALRLNARVSELTLAAECARTDGESARAELHRVRARHDSEVQALEKRQKQLVSALRAVGGQAQPLDLAEGSETRDPGSAQPLAQTDSGRLEGGTDALMAIRDRNQTQAVQEAELAVAVMQAKLLEAVASQREAGRQVQQAQQGFDAERAYLEQQVRRSKEEGSVRIQTLEDTIRKLGNRSDLHQELARLGGEASFLRRTEARLKSNLGFAEDKTNELQREVTILRQQVASYEAIEHEAQVLEDVQRSVSRESSASGNIAARMNEFSRELNSEGSQPHIVARLVERAEASEVQLAQAQQELKALKQVATARAAAEGAGTSAAMSAAQVLEERTGDLQRQLLLAQSELKAAREDAHIHELDKSQLQAQVAEASREVASAQARVAEKERLTYDSEHLALQRDSQAGSDQWKEAADAARQKADAERRAESAQAAQLEADQNLRLAELEVARLKASLEAKTKAAKRAEQAALQKAERAEHELAVARRECERAAGDAEDRKVQLSVLMETVETLQAGTPGEKDQRIVSLTAQLTTARMKEAVSERRAAQLQCELEEQASMAHKVQAQLDKAEHLLSEKDTEGAIGKAAAEAAARNISALRGGLKAHADAAAKGAREVDDAHNAASKAEAEAAGLRAALDAARTRHFEQLTKERAEAAAIKRETRPSALQTVASPVAEGSMVPQPSSLSLAAGIDELVAALKPRRPTGGVAREDSSLSTSGDDETPHRVVQRMKVMLLEAQVSSAKAEADLRIAAAEAASLASKVRPLEMALERRTNEREAAVAELEASVAITAARQVQASTHSEQHISLQARRVAAISDQLDKAHAQVTQLSIRLKQAHTQESNHKWQRDALQRKLAVCEGDIQALESKLSAAHMEAAGTADASRSQSIEAAIQQRDSDIKAYFDTHLLKHVLNPDHQKRALALTREICGLKVAHQQLIAAHAAAKKLAGSASLQSVTLRQQLQVLEEQLTATQESRPNPASSSNEAASESSAASQLASKANEVYQLQEELLQQRQKLAFQDIQVQELHAALQAAKNKAREAQDEGLRTVQQVREQLASEFSSERDSLLREIQLTQQQQQEAVAQAQKEAAASRQDFAEQLQEVQQQSQVALDACPTAEQYNQVVDTANVAQQNMQDMEAECSAVQAENKQLQSVVRSLEVQVSELQADVETRSSALESLEGTLSRIERSVESGRDRSPIAGGARSMSASKGSSGAGGRPRTALGLGKGSSGHSDGALAALSRQLVQAKMAEADAQRKHRVSARAELSLRQRLSQREDRISELKDALAAAKGQLPGTRSAAPPARSHSPRPCLTTIPDHHRSRAESHSHTDAQSPQGRTHCSHAQQMEPLSGLEQHPALSPEDADKEEQVSHCHFSRRGAQPAQNQAGAQESHRQQGAAAYRTAVKLPYFQTKSHAAAELALNSLAPPQQAAVQQTETPDADHAIQNLPRVVSLRSPRGYTSPRRLNEQISDLKIELARRDAEVEYLEAQLAEAVAANRPYVRPQGDRSPDKDISLKARRAEELEASLGRLQKECSQAVAAAQAVVGRPSTPRGSPRSSEDGPGGADVQDVVRQLVAKLKDRDASLKRLRAVAKTTAEKASKEKAAAAAQPLESSQRAVIRDLSLRVANLTRGNNQLKEERERAQERLRTLRASLGSSKAPLVEEAPGPHQRLPAPTPALPRGTRPKDPPKKKTTPHAPATPSHPTALMMVPHSRRTTNAPPEAADSGPEADANGPEWVAVDSKMGDSHNAGRLLECQAVQGLCQLLEHHLAVLEQSQQPMGDLLQPGAMPDGPELQRLLASKEALVSEGAKQAVAAATVAASAELAAMRSTLQVLSSHLEALQADPAALATKGASEPDAECSEGSSFLGAVESPEHPLLALPGPPTRPRHHEQAAQTLPVSLSVLSLAASSTQDDVLAEQVQQAAERAQKWKGRCGKLRQELMETQTAAASLDAALHERLAGLEKSSEGLTLQHRKEVSRLEAALAGAQAAKKNLSEQQAQHSSAGESDLQAAQAAQAEADAKASSLQRQIDTLRAQAAAARCGLQEEANSLKAALSKEKSERARIVLSLRDTITGLKQAGDVEGRLKADLVQTHEHLAASRAAQEQLEARLTQKRSEVKSLNIKLETAQRKLSQHSAEAELANQQTTLTMTQAQHQITGLESQLRDSCAQLFEAQGKSAAADAECKSAKESCEVMEKEVARLDQLNQDLKSTCQQLQATVDDLSRERQDIASAKWEALQRSRRHRGAVHQMRGDLQAAESENRSLAEELERTRVKGQQSVAEAERLQKRVDDLQHFSDIERQQLAERHVCMMSDLEKTMEEEREALRREAAAMAASAAAAGEDRARNALSARLNEAQQSAFQDITNVANERRQLSDELESLRSQFKAYQKVKTREISSLDHRVRILLQSQAVAGTMHPDDHTSSLLSPGHKPLPSRVVKKSPAKQYGKPVMVPSSDGTAASDVGQGQGSTSDGDEDTFPASYQPPLAGLMFKGKVQCASLTAAAEVGMALESEAVASAVREADFERMQREAAEAGVASLHDALEKLKQKLRSTQRDLRAAKDVASSSAAHAAGVQANEQELQQLQEQLVASQEALKNARAESARRLKALQSLQQQGSEGPHLVANAAFLAEKSAKEAAEGKLTTLRRSVVHKDELLKTLKAKVDDLEAAVRAAKAADHSIEVQTAESRVRSLQGSLTRKEDTIRELRERMDQACRAAAEKGAEQEAERQLVVVKKLKAEVTRKEGMLKATQSELDKVRQEISEAAAGEAALRDTPAQHHSGSGLAAVKDKVRAVLDALRALAKLALRTSAAMQTATTSLQTAAHSPSPQEDVNAAAVARMVDMSLEEVADLLGGASSCGAGAEDSGLLAKQVAQTLLELEAALMTSSGKHAKKQSRSSENQMDGQALEEMLEGLQHHASRAEAMLAEAVRAAVEQKMSGRHIAAHQSKRKKKAAQNPVMRLEEDLLRASHGIEAELYQDL